ncbi:hypothetical protein HYV86_01390 [Candidatus Woesearchaeota archaeon]|nr:hypothetical protein [Candidatus Woesearchaeota archaeon]
MFKSTVERIVTLAYTVGCVTAVGFVTAAVTWRSLSEDTQHSLRSQWNNSFASAPDSQRKEYSTIVNQAERCGYIVNSNSNNSSNNLPNLTTPPAIVVVEGGVEERDINCVLENIVGRADHKFALNSDPTKGINAFTAFGDRTSPQLWASDLHSAINAMGQVYAFVPQGFGENLRNDPVISQYGVLLLQLK